MKLISLLLAVACCSQVTLAQSAKKPIGQPPYQNSFINYLLHQNNTRTAMKTTAFKERLIAQSTREYIVAPDSLTDSVDVKYANNGRGSAFDKNILLYQYNYPYSVTPLINFLGYINRPMVQYDTIMRWTNTIELPSPVLKYGFYEMVFCNYNPGNLLAQYIDLFKDSVNNQNMSYINNYDLFGNLVNSYSFTLTLGTPDSFYKQCFSYNASKKLIADSLYLYKGTSWVMEAKSYYTYDASGNLITVDTYADTSMPFREKLQYSNTYDASNRLLTVQVSEFDGTSLMPYEKDTFAYANSTIGFHTSWKQHRWDGVNHYWAPITYMYKHLTSSNLTDTAYVKGFDSLSNSWVAQDMYTLSYDTMNNPVLLNDYVYNGVAYPATPSYVTTYYYQQYIGAGIATTKEKTETVLLYPNPTTNNINISRQGNPDNNAMHISIMNMNGQLLRTISTIWQSKQTTVPIADLAPGMYNIIIYNAAGAVIYSDKVIKQ